MKECLIKLCTASPVGILENTDFNVGLDNLNLEIEILKSRVDSMQSLMNSQGSGTAPKICELSNEIALLKIDLEEEKFRNVCLEREVKRLQQKVELINSYRNGSASTTNNSELINIPPTQDIVVIEDNRQSLTSKVLNDESRTQQDNGELVVIEDVHQFSSNQVIVDQLSVVEKIDKQPREYRSEQSLASTTNGSASTTNNTELTNIPPTQDIVVIEDNRQSLTSKVLNDQITTQQNIEKLVIIEDVHQFSSNHEIVDQLSVAEKNDKQPREYRSEQIHTSTQQNNNKDTVVIEEDNRLSPNPITIEHLSVTGKIDKQLQDYRNKQSHVFKHQHLVRQNSIKHQASQTFSKPSYKRKGLYQRYHHNFKRQLRQENRSKINSELPYSKNGSYPNHRHNFKFKHQPKQIDSRSKAPSEPPRRRNGSYQRHHQNFFSINALSEQKRPRRKHLNKISAQTRTLAPFRQMETLV